MKLGFFTDTKFNLQRVQRVRKKIEQKRMLIAQAEVRQTRTRRQTQKPDYVYSNNDFDSEASANLCLTPVLGANIPFFLESRMMGTSMHIKKMNVKMMNTNKICWMEWEVPEEDVLQRLLPLVGRPVLPP